MNKSFNGSFLNIGSNVEHTIKDYTKIICKFLSYKGKIIFDNNKPSGTPRKKLNTSQASKLGWKSTTTFLKGLEITYKSYLKSIIKVQSEKK